MDMEPCNLGKFLVVPTFVARRLQICKDARDTSGEGWNYLSRRQSFNLPKRQLLRNLGICFLPQIYDKWAKHTLICYGCVFKTWLVSNHIKRVIILTLQIICAAFHFVIWIALNEEIRVMALELSLSLHLMIYNYYLSQPNKVQYDVRKVD